MPIEGEPGKTKWVFTAANGHYLAGDFDGTRFTPEEGPLTPEFGANYYAVQTYSDIPERDGRRIQIAWMNGGSYQVNGGGLNCNGRLDWYPGRNGRVDIDLYRSACGGRGTDWTGDSLNCRTGWRVFGNQLPGVAVPAPPGPRGNTLNCTYVPQASGYSPIQVTARRI